MQLLSCEHPMVYGTEMIHFDPHRYFMQNLQLFVSQMDRVFSRLENTFEESEIIFSCIYEREYWDDMTLCMAQALNWYVKTQKISYHKSQWQNIQKTYQALQSTL